MIYEKNLENIVAPPPPPLPPQDVDEITPLQQSKKKNVGAGSK